MKVFNTLTKKKEELKSINDKEIRMYSWAILAVTILALYAYRLIIMHILEI